MSKKYYADEPKLSQGKVFYPVSVTEIIDVPFLGVHMVSRVYDYCESRIEAEDMVFKLNKREGLQQ